MIHCHAAIKDKAFALPAAVFLRDILKIFQNATLQMVDLVKALGLHQRACFLAADAAGAEHRQFAWTRSIIAAGQGGGPFGKFAKAVGFRINRAAETANGCFIAITGVDHHHIGIIDQRVPFGRIDIGAGGLCRADIRTAHGDDLALQPHLHTQESLFARE